MNALAKSKLRLRSASERHLMAAVQKDLGKGAPGTTEPYVKGGLFWRFVFVPVYRRVPWTVKEQAMSATGMTAAGWKKSPREPGTPWQPPTRPVG